MSQLREAPTAAARALARRPSAWSVDLAVTLLGLAVYLAAFGLALYLLTPGAPLLLVAPSVGVAVLWLLLTHGRRCWLALAAVTLGCAIMAPATGLVPPERLPLAVAAHTLVALGVRWSVAGSISEPAPAAALDLTDPRSLTRLSLLTLVSCLLTAPLVVLATEGGTSPTGLVVVMWCTRNLLAVLLVSGTGLLVRQAVGARLRGGPTALGGRAGRGELAALVAVSLVLGVVAVWADHGLPLGFLLVIAVAWAGVRLSPLAAAVHVSISAVAALAGALAGRGGVEQVGDPLARAFTAQAFVGLVWLLGVGISLAVQRQARLSADLDDARTRLHRVVGALDDLVWSAEVTPQRLRLAFVSEGSPTGLSAHAGLRPGDDLVAALLGRTPEAQHALVRDFHERLLREEHAEVEVRLLDLRGRARWTWWRGTVRHEPGRTVVDGTAVDVTERRRLDDLRAQFLAIAGHELRTPLTAVRGYAELLTDDLPRDTDSARWAGAVAAGALRLQTIVEEYFDLARLDHGHASLSPTQVDVRTLAADALEHWRHRAAAARVTCSLDATGPVTAWVDPSRLAQVIDNLLANALKYGRPGGHVVLRLATAPGGAAVLVVDDDGIGVGPEDLPMLFERFYRTEGARSHTVDGSGLGLSVVKAVVEASGGAVLARPSTRGGLAVEVMLPGHAPSGGGPDAAEALRAPAPAERGASRSPSGHLAAPE